MMTLVKEDVFEKIEQHLNNYVSYKIGIENLKEQLDHMYPKLTATYDVGKEGTSGTFLFNSNTENYAIERAEMGEVIEKEIKKYDVVLSSIDRAIQSLKKDKQKEYVELHYFRGLSNKDVADRMKYSLKMVYKLRDEFKEEAIIRLKNLVMVDL